MNARPPLTAEGMGRSATFVPSPSWPDQFGPQQYAFPAEVRPHPLVMLTNEAPSAAWIRTGPEVRVCDWEPDCPLSAGRLGTGKSAGGKETSLRSGDPGPRGPSTRIWNGCADADLVVTGTTTVVADGATVADAVPVAIAVTDANPVGTRVPVADSGMTEATDVKVANGAAGAAGAAIVAAVVMVATDVGETVGTDWLDAAGGGIRATKSPPTANTGTARRLNM